MTQQRGSAGDDLMNRPGDSAQNIRHKFALVDHGNRQRIADRLVSVVDVVGARLFGQVSFAMGVPARHQHFSPAWNFHYW